MMTHPPARAIADCCYPRFLDNHPCNSPPKIAHNYRNIESTSEMATSIERATSGDSAVIRLFNLKTGKLRIARFTVENLEERTFAAAELFEKGFYRTAPKASDAWEVPYHRLRGRILGRKPHSENGGHSGVFSTVG